MMADAESRRVPWKKRATLDGLPRSAKSTCNVVYCASTADARINDSTLICRGGYAGCLEPGFEQGPLRSALCTIHASRNARPNA